MNLPEYILIGFIFIGAILGYIKGLLRQVSTFLGLIIGYIVASIFLAPSHKFLIEKGILSPDFSTKITFILIILIVFLSIKFLSGFIENILKSIGLNFTNKFAGFALGGLKYFLIGMSIFCIFLTLGIISEKNTSKNFIEFLSVFKSVIFSYVA